MGKKKYNIEFVKEYCRERDIEVLDDEYVNTRNKLKLIS